MHKTVLEQDHVRDEEKRKITENIQILQKQASKHKNPSTIISYKSENFEFP